MSSPAQSAPAGPVWKVSQLRVLNSEFIKLRTVRSTFWTFLSLVAALIGLGVLFSWATLSAYQQNQLPPNVVMDATGTSLSGVFLAQVAVAVLGVLVVTGEYASGMIRATLSAVPKRIPVVIAKAVSLALTTFVISLISAFVAFYLGQLVFQADGLEDHLGDPGVLRAIIGCALYLAVMALAAMGLGLIIRSTAASVAILVVFLFVLPILANFLPINIQNAVVKWFPGTAGQSIIQVAQQPNLLGPWEGFAVFCGYALVVLLIGTFLLKRRDA